MKIINKIFKNPLLLILFICKKFPFRYISSEKYLKLFYYTYHHERLNLDNPKGYNEKLQWLKLYDKNKLYVNLTDKYLVRDFVKERIGEKYLTKLYGVWDSVKEIDFDNLPNSFVIKCNHDSGSVVVCKDKSNIDIKKIKRLLKKSLKKNYYWEAREENYKFIKKKIIAEEFLNNGNGDGLIDYKFFCFDGEPKFIQVDTGRFTDHIRNFYDTEWNFINVQNGCKNDAKKVINIPINFNEMIELSRKLSAGFIHVRVDFYNVNGKIYFGEMTFHHGGGAMRIEPIKYDVMWGNELRLPCLNKNE